MAILFIDLNNSEVLFMKEEENTFKLRDTFIVVSFLAF